AACSSLLRLGCKPRKTAQALLFKCTNLVGFLESQADVVKPIQQTVLAEWIDVKRQFCTIGFDHTLTLKIDLELITRRSFNFFKKTTDFRFRKNDGKQPVLEAVVEEDIS